MTNLIGKWVIVEVDEPIKLYLKRKYSNKEVFEQKLREHETLQKYIQIEDKIIVISLTNQSWAGIVEYNKEDIIFFEDNVIKRKVNNKKDILNPYNYKKIQEKTFKKNNIVLKYEDFSNSIEFYDMLYNTIAKEYNITKTETENLNISKLPRVKVVNI